MKQRSIISIPIIAGHYAVDFVNTVDDRHADESKEFLRDYADLMKWETRTKLLSSTERKQVKSELRTNRERASKIFTEILALRNQFHQVLLALDFGSSTSLHVAALETRFRSVLDSSTLVQTGKRYRFMFTTDPLLFIPSSLIVSFVSLIASDQILNVRKCESPQCGWFFIDNSRGKRRRWCSMEDCGNVAKQQRFRSAQFSD